MQLKSRLIETIKNGEFGRVENDFVVFTAKEFKEHFSDIKTDYVSTYLPSATMERGETKITNARFLVRVRRGVYRVHPDALVESK